MKTRYPCPCGREKFGHLTRKEAKRVARRTTHDGHLSAFQCSAGFWHLGNLPPGVIAGSTSSKVLRWRDVPPVTIEDQALAWLRSQVVRSSYRRRT